MTCGDLDILFPRNTTGSLQEPGSIAVQCTPTVLIFLFWLSMELARRRRRSSTTTFALTYTIASAASGGVGLLAWRTFDLLECENVSDAEAWRMVGVIGAPLAAIVIVLIGRRLVRLGTLLALSVAGGTIFADWALREWVAPEAAQPFAAIQHLWLFLALTCLLHLPPKSPRPKCISNDCETHPKTLLDRVKPTPPSSKGPKKGKAVSLKIVDPLSRNDSNVIVDVPENRHSSWFN
ncbi:MAG: hypothetical protein CBC12_07265 [Candidatus Puniceispirillum sp. TMED52]|nr:MAG: hypothetical protein CBC12_07265 [Candidatus Puniceispirillum sp. TMED52]